MPGELPHHLTPRALARSLTQTLHTVALVCLVASAASAVLLQALEPEAVLWPALVALVPIAALLAGLMRRIAALEDPNAREIMAVSPAMPEAKRGNWRYVGFKGGSEPGVLNLTWLLQDQAGDWRILSLSWNDPAAPVDAGTLELIAQRILSLP